MAGLIPKNWLIIADMQGHSINRGRGIYIPTSYRQHFLSA
ncbi:hypothetical protein [Lacrimispora sp.]